MKSFLENSDMLYYLSTDLSGNYTFVNEHFRKRMSFMGTDFIGKNSLETIIQEDWDICRKTVEACFLNPEDSHFVELRKPDLNGKNFWTSWEFRARLDHHHAVTGIDCVGHDITKTKNDEEHISELVKKTELILEKSLTGYWDLDIASKTATTSDTFKRMLGYSVEEFDFTLDTWMQLVVEEDLPVVLHALNTHYESRGKEPLNVEIRYKHKNGSHLWVICTGSVIVWDELDRPLRLVGVHIDITKRKEAEETLIKKDKLLNTFINSTPDLFFLKDERLRYVIANKALQELYQLPEHGILGKTDFDILPFEVAKICKEGDELPLKDGGKVVREERDVFGKTVQTYKFPVELGNGRVGVGTYARDVTGLKEAERLVKQKNRELEHFRFAINSAVIVISFDLDWNIIEVNKKLCDISEYSEAELIGRKGSIFRNLKHPEQFYETIRKKLNSGMIWEGTVCQTKKSGKPFWTHSVIIPQTDDDGVTEEFLCVAYDISAKVKLQDRIEKESEQRKQMAQSFLSYQEKERHNVIKELHDGISQILFASRMHLENSKTVCDEEFSKGFNLLNEASDELKNITTHETIFWSNDLTLEQALSNYLKKIDGTNKITFISSIEKINETIDISDKDKLNYFRIIQAATQNSIRHSNAGQVNIRIVERLDYLTTTIIDNGIGFDKNLVSKGMGISNIENRVRIMNGSIKIFSKQGKGTVVAFQIPLHNENNNNTIG